MAENLSLRAADASEFVRELTEVRPDGARRPRTAWAYYYNRATARHPRITSGDRVGRVRRRGDPAAPLASGRTLARHARCRPSGARSLA
jgi:hypothetical protein